MFVGARPWNTIISKSEFIKLKCKQTFDDSKNGLKYPIMGVDCLVYEVRESIFEVRNKRIANFGAIWFLTLTLSENFKLKYQVMVIGRNFDDLMP